MVTMHNRTETILLILILLLAGGLRFIQLDSAPPGLTHDEADHGLDAVGVLEGVTPIYFTVGYGREPLYDYSTAPVMLLLGKTYLAGRVTAALYGMGLLLLVYAWVRLATQNPYLALATTAGLAVSFWGVSVSRHALRTITLPVTTMAATLAMWTGIGVKQGDDGEPIYVPGSIRPQIEIVGWGWFALAGVFLGLSFYTYLAARLMWLVFPAFFIFLSITQHGVIRRVWPGLLIMLAVAALVAAPLAVYLFNNPTAEVRIGQLSGPLDALLAGNFEPLLTNVRAGLGMITVSGDDLWLYNIPGKPLLGPFFSLLFYLGFSLAVISILYPYRPVKMGRRTTNEAFLISSSNAFMLLILLIGLTPAMITGVGASNTRVIGMLPALYYFPALAVIWLADQATRHVGESGHKAVWVAFGVLILYLTGQTYHNYFDIWNNDPDVRVAYHTTLVETLDHLDTHPTLGPDIALSSITPGRFHDPAVAALHLERTDLALRWFDGRSALSIPASEDAHFFISDFARPTSLLADWLTAHSAEVDRIALRPDDRNRTVIVSQFTDTELLRQSNSIITAGELLSLIDHGITPSSDTIQAGDTIELLTFWRVEDTTTQEIVLFTHVLDEQGQLIAQQDLLGVPPTSWYPGDIIAQHHTLILPADLPPQSVTLFVGAYTRAELTRLPLATPDGSLVGDSYPLLSIEVAVP